MAKLKYLVIHCTDTTESMNVTPAMIRSWHKDKKPVGRGWSRVGYSDMIMLDGAIKNLRPYDEDDQVEEFEVTNGAKGYNGVSRHIVYVGGRDNSLRKPKDTLSVKQQRALTEYILKFLANHPEAKVIGHNQINDYKACPSFDAPEKFVFEAGLPKENFILTEEQEKRYETHEFTKIDSNKVEELFPEELIGPKTQKESIRNDDDNYNEIPENQKNTDNESQ